jgi:hypothetical protein
MRPVVRIRDHGIGRYDDTTLSRELLLIRFQAKAETTVKTHSLFLVCGENGNLAIRHIGPLHELLLPLHDGHAAKKRLS